ncbi:pseudouridine-5'-phosphate glycosidase [Brevibacillus reuszeri]|uniref:Pseudouridine-5'-phosphate glycosidase n=1 Tax=Brevibacillus reuszeri TaxID=54915 RepID=A0A0K9YV83_9BACL|nr:pseudouridine-5'-phosphate glycosidase [Brevibacillus reuszeri]KNB72608.1 pseudouridine-5'-phosphate glycosidase [Brevibacillus reuszeri]MED1860704.1 pseudouridine-5'-phosphate glycosidase [Brevibacillus reuszeri]GED70373.1 pseudouridine-5'-phosphate glycosidase [Brevibacillus reuszeri]
MKEYMSYSEEVTYALEHNLPIVALETTIISHGMPYPQNRETATEVEQIIRDHGAVPATIGFLDGNIKVGLNANELEEFATNKDVAKVSRRDIPYILSSRKIGAATVAATMIGAQLAGIHMFATGGIGGVHREGEITWDVSADLTELAQTNVAVVCAGCKSILDIGRTLEYLETCGVPVVGYQTQSFPAFYSRDSGFAVQTSMESPETVSAMLHTKWQMGLKGGAVIANPIPMLDAIAYEEIEDIIVQAMHEANKHGISGKQVTPFMLAKVKELTGGKSLAANIALVKNNAKLAAQIAVALKQNNK